METGGEIEKIRKKASVKKDGSTCSSFCERLHRNATPRRVFLSNRNGRSGKGHKFKDGVIVPKLHNQDWSGWRDVVSAKSEGQWMVCGTAVNWDNKRSATKKLSVEY